MVALYGDEPIKKVMISSTVLDLPEHRESARRACAALGMFADMMEDLTALDTTAVQVCKNMVDRSDFYIGIFGQRYGTIPKGSKISFTQIELQHAVKRGVPCFIFLMHDDHSLRKADIDCTNERKHKELIKYANSIKTCISFKSPDDLYGKIIVSLAKHRWREERTS